MEHSVFDHEGPWTEAAYLALPHDGRVEVVDGTLLVGPGATRKRLWVIERIREAVAAALPTGLKVDGPVALRLGRDCVLVPDLVVTASASVAGEDGVLDGGAALMVIEVIGSDHGAPDRSFKPQVYARSRIPYSLLIDHDGPFAVADMIIGGRYHEYAHGEQRLRIEEPFPLDVDLAAVTAFRTTGPADETGPARAVRGR